ncbi:MAG: hypothetical protein V2I50_12795 [Desulfuromusa sp.]|jgi:hypothetical protein|nr:hypothetical protein [Desulfuromusa sp.]
MLNKLAIFSLIVVNILFSTQVAMSQDVIADEKIMSSFAKIIRENQYICRPCQRVQPLENKSSALSYEVICNYDLVYRVVITPRNNMIVRPINGLQIGSL